MSTRYFAMIFGLFYLLIGVMGLIPGLITQTETGAVVDILEGNLLGIFPVNIVHTLVHLVVGLWGVVAYRSFDASRTFSRAVGVLFLVLFLMGLIPGLNTMFGMAPLMGADVWLHLVSGLLGVVFGFLVRPTMVGTDI